MITKISYYTEWIYNICTVFTSFSTKGFLNITGKQYVAGNIDYSLDGAREILGLDKISRTENFEPTVNRKRK